MRCSHTTATGCVPSRQRDGRGDPLLALSVLHKRAFSSAWSLAQSVERRLAALADGEAASLGQQLALPLATRPAISCSPTSHRRWPEASPHGRQRARTASSHRALVGARAAFHCRDEAAAARRAAGGARGSRAVVFTEYRDTLAHVRRRLTRQTVVLHGGLTGEERAAALTAFAAMPAGVLLATDAAAEGSTSRTLPARDQLEMPWNPMRLEQRIDASIASASSARSMRFI